MGCIGSRNIISGGKKEAKYSAIPQKDEKEKSGYNRQLEDIEFENKKTPSQKITYGNSKCQTNVIAQDNYVIMRSLGNGPLCSMYKTIQKNTGLIRSMKILKKEDFTSMKINLEDYIKELEATLKLDHQNLIKVCDYFTDEKNLYVIMEYLQGIKLYDAIVSKINFNEKVAKSMISHLLSAVHYLHMQNIFPSINPDEIFVEKTQDEFKVKILPTSFLTFGHIHTTLCYLSPEELKKSHCKESAIWSIGVILYILLAGNPPFSGDSLSELTDNITEGNYSMVGKEWDTISDLAKDLLSKMMQTDHNKRISPLAALHHPWICQKDSDSINIQFASSNLSCFYAKEKFQKAIFEYINNCIALNKEFAGLKKGMNLIDTKGGESLTYNELKRGFQAFYGMLISSEKINNILSNLQPNSEGIIPFNWLLEISYSKMYQLAESKLKNAFTEFTLNSQNDGLISKDELRKLIFTGDFSLSDHILRVLYGGNYKSEYINYQELYDLLSGSYNYTMKEEAHAEKVTKENSKTSAEIPLAPGINKKENDLLINYDFDMLLPLHQSSSDSSINE